ncbi:MAG TPA: ATP-binding protein [Casimicrobiaceae bacterium]|nr:ATP-binding protein [Casimicrobiaceae bacterium]
MQPASAEGSAHAHLEALRNTAQLLGSSLNLESLLTHVLQACVPAIGDCGVLDLRIGDVVRRVSFAPGRPEVESALAQIGWTARPHEPFPLCALSSGRAALHPRIDEAWHARFGRDDPYVALLQRLQVRSLLTVPLRFRDEVTAAITLFVTASTRVHDAADLALASDIALLAAPPIVSALLLERHRRSERALRNEAERLKLAIDAAQLGIWEWDIPRNQVTWSDHVYALHGLQLGDFPGTLQAFETLVHPDDREQVARDVAGALQAGSVYATEFRTVRPDGSVRWLATRARVTRDAAGAPTRLIGATSDVTERVELLAAERAARSDMEAVRQRLERLAAAGAVFANSLQPDDTLQAIASVIVPDIADWCRVDLLDANGELQRALTYHLDPERTRIAQQLVQRLRASPDTPGSMAWAVRTRSSHLARFDPPSAYDAIRDRDLLEFACTIGMRAYYVVPLVARGRTLGALAALQAESGRAFTEDDCALIQELAQRAALAIDNARLYAEAKAARHDAERASRAKDEFLAMLGHELRNPLAPIVTALDLMRLRGQGVLESERRIVERQVAHLARLVDDLLDVSRITQGKIELKREPVDLADTVGKALELVRPGLERRKQHVDVRMPRERVTVIGDAVRLAQVFGNLLSNAVKFTHDGGRIEVRLEHDERHAEVIVSDDGEGISAELLPRVFDLFVQGEQAIDRQEGGLGLGLAIVNTLVRMHGGEVNAASDGRGHGAQFRVRLPIASEDDWWTPRIVETPATHGSGRALVVDDNADAAAMIGLLLESAGYEVRIAHSGDSALDLLDAFVPEVGVLDIGLPGMDGYELARRIQRDPRCVSTRLVALTGYGGESDREQAYAAGFAAHLTKPVEGAHLLRVIEDLLARQAPAT